MVDGVWIPDFTADNPWQGMPEDYSGIETFVSTPTTPEAPWVEWYEENLETLPPAFIKITVTETQWRTVYGSVKPPVNVYVTPTPPGDWATTATEGLHKPIWLTDLLSKLNWEFMGVNLYIGDAVERAIDWVIAWLNWFDYLVEKAMAVAEDAYRNVHDAVTAVKVSVNQRIQGALNVIETWQSSLNTWWLAQKTELLDAWASSMRDLNQLSIKWDYFWTVLYPQSVSFDALADWWRSEFSELQGVIDGAFSIREGLWQGWQDWRDKVTEFFTDPEEWLYKAVDRIIERFW